MKVKIGSQKKIPVFTDVSMTEEECMDLAKSFKDNELKTKADPE